jgi:hypothetical protein
VVWLGVGVVLFSLMNRLHPRYVEAFDPAVAAAAGIGIVWASGAGRSRRVVLTLALTALAAYAWYLEGGPGAVVWVTAAAAALAAVVALLPGVRQRPVVIALALVAALSLPVTVAVALVRGHASDAGIAGYMRPHELSRLSAYLLAHRHGARYEVAVASATQAGSLIVHDAQPVLVMTSYDGRPIVSVAALRRLVSRGAVRYALLGARCHPGDTRTLAQCSAPALWARAHGADVSRSAGLGRHALLWRLSTR